MRFSGATPLPFRANRRAPRTCRLTSCLRTHFLRGPQQARRAGRASRPGNKPGNAGFGPASSFWQPFANRRRRASRYRPSARQGDQRLPCRGENRCRPPVPGRAICRAGSDQGLFGACLGHSKPAQRRRGCADLSPSGESKEDGVCETGRGRAAVTEYRVLRSADGVTLVECRPRTGRTHQIRVHLKTLAVPFSATLSMGAAASFSRHMLHAWKLEFRHPARRPAFWPSKLRLPPEFASLIRIRRTPCHSRLL